MIEDPSNQAVGGPIAAAMSGGVDSSVAAALLREQGRQVFGITAVMTGEESRCCSTEDVKRAAGVASGLGISHHVVDVREAFKRFVLDTFTAEYLAGRTPSPCAICNREVKFGALFQAARRVGASALATGHYAGTRLGPDGTVRLRRGRDRARDQSYFLARLTQSQLARAVFPLEDMEKNEVVAHARRRALDGAVNRESRELCFVAHGTHGDWIDLRCLRTPGPGDIEDTSGNRVGSHAGIHHYTIGQRKGLGLAMGYPAYVTAIDARRNVLVIGRRSEVMQSDLLADQLNWIAGSAPAGRFRADVQIRYNHPAAPADLKMLEDGRLRAVFDEPQFAVTPGQLAVFYSNDEVLGSGWIARCEND
jgi:tRNA-specific 2-thiouridylase